MDNEIIFIEIIKTYNPTNEWILFVIRERFKRKKFYFGSTTLSRFVIFSSSPAFDSGQTSFALSENPNKLLNFETLLLHSIYLSFSYYLHSR